MNRAPERLQKITLRFALPAILAFFAPGVARAAATPPQLAISPEATERLRKAGLDAKDPNLGAKLRSLAGPASSAYARSHVLSFTARSHTAVRPQRFSRAAAASVAGSPSPGPKITIPGHGTIAKSYDINASPNASPLPLGANPKFSSGNYLFLVMTDQKIADPSNVSTAVSFGCSANPGVYVATDGWAADDPMIPGLQKLSFSNGSYPYYVSVNINWLWIGQPRPAQMTLSFPNVVTAPYQVTLQPDTETATISVTVDHVPQVTGVGTFGAWGSTNISNANAKLGAPGTARVGTGAGNWQTQTTGDDLIGVGVALGPGWKVVSAVVKSAMSVAAPQDLTPENPWRGAAVTLPPSASDLRTAVHWHYDGIDSLDYTLEWTLSGPMGQRPLLTMAKNGSCDQ
jgi:hypothetical protein